MDIYWVEDDPNITDQLVPLLEKQGHRITISRSFQEAKTHLGFGIPYDHGICDWQLGDGYGTDLLPLFYFPVVGYSSLPEEFARKGYGAFSKVDPMKLLDYFEGLI